MKWKLKFLFHRNIDMRVLAGTNNEAFIEEFENEENGEKSTGEKECNKAFFCESTSSKAFFQDTQDNVNVKISPTSSSEDKGRNWKDLMT